MSPAPGLRNKGQSVVEQVAEKRHIPNIPDARTRQAAHRARHATGWEEAATTLAQRAEKVRIDDERARHLYLYAKDVRAGLATPRVASPAPARSVVPRYWLGFCRRCEAEAWVYDARPRVPLCQACRSAS